ncbi:MAG: AAA family ATPase [Lachnospiraceae bacterium]|nr:AAA family ATPase [Lachnospiraceae bacterium]
MYLLSFKLSEETVGNPNIYPYNVFRGKEIEPFVFSKITVLYGNNGSGKSTILNIIANKLKLPGKEYATSNSFGRVDYCGRFSEECAFGLADDENSGRPIRSIPKNSRFIKSEDILYEIKKVQQRQVLAEGLLYDCMKAGRTRREAETFLASKEGPKLEELEFGQEKFSNGETAMQYFDEFLTPDALFLMDEPEISLSPANQVALAQEINKMAHFLGCQFIIATHSPFLLGTLDAKIYNIDSVDYRVCKWSELENVRYFYEFFKKREADFTM